MLFRMTGFLKDGIFIAFYGNKGKEENRMKGVWDKVNSGLNFLFGIAGIIMVLVASYAVLARNVLLVSTPWSDVLLKLIFIWTIYMGSAVLFMNDELISLTLLEDKYKESKPKVYGSLKAIQYVAAVGRFIFLLKCLKKCCNAGNHHNNCNNGREKSCLWFFFPESQLRKSNPRKYNSHQSHCQRNELFCPKFFHSIKPPFL